MDAKIVCISRIKKSVQIEPRAAWFPRDTCPSVELSGQQDWTYPLGAITEDCDFFRFTEFATADYAKHIILVLCKEFKEDSIAALDRVSYFQASAITDLALRDDLTLVALPVYSPELNSVEERWRQLQDALNDRFFDSPDELTTAIDTALHQLSLPGVSNYF